MKILIASNNPKKLKELQAILPAEIVPLGDHPSPKEDGATFAENALIKARAGVAASGLASIADDSGLCVEALGGMPGVLSARWSGNGDDANNALVLHQMEDMANRNAAFVSVCALVTPDGQEFVVEGRWEGELLREPVGENGFGYDPIFRPFDGDGRSSAQLSPEEKNAISHRAKALAQLVPIIEALNSAE
ncbi:RdgB/HAM1 family non-canonical purine NTP pyrophosphatase [Corynebacterium kozikiae]|uniref:RdgB/HAM1 family non-canonical purine NTP pyrophosphatase n=1 Tax=Corynebacterium kozikiae TaxID=2968469 RepID=UPI00211C5F52|nr:RdgB/HAM1 family non-canonical purine NTP pyrophosphatase [Corynebacterium sp. 76QC2CO]MCQ9343276.1 RdgB/HAM1 family non-canonical purine NTP pyrophosphatase [Corynebacterium sp. 76QC2CO]